MPFQIIRNDITKVKADVIVNSANPQPKIGPGVDSAIYEAAGKEELLAKRKQIGRLRPGQTALTPAFHLNAKYILHTVGPVWGGGILGEADALRSCYNSCLSLADSLKAESIAFPLISTGNYRFPKDLALNIALEVIGKFLLSHEMDVYLVVYDQKSFVLSKELMGEIEVFIDEHTVSEQEAQRGNRQSRGDFLHHLFPREEQSSVYGYMPEKRGSGRYEEDYDEAGYEEPHLLKGQHNLRRKTSSLRLEDDQDENNPDSAPDILEDLWGECASPAPLQEVEEAQIKEKASGKKKAQASSPAPQTPSFYSSPECDPRPKEAGREEGTLPSPYQFTASGIPGSDSAVFYSDKSLEELVSFQSETFQEKLLKLIDQSGMNDVTVYKKANIDRKLFSRIRCNKDYHPTKKTALAFAIALELDLPSLLDLLGRAELTLSPCSKFDLIISYFVTHKNYNIFEINAALFKYDLPTLGE